MVYTLLLYGPFRAYVPSRVLDVWGTHKSKIETEKKTARQANVLVYRQCTVDVPSDINRMSDAGMSTKTCTLYEGHTLKTCC